MTQWDLNMTCADCRAGIVHGILILKMGRTQEVWEYRYIFWDFRGTYWRLMIYRKFAVLDIQNMPDGWGARNIELPRKTVMDCRHQNYRAVLFLSTMTQFISKCWLWHNRLWWMLYGLFFLHLLQLHFEIFLFPFFLEIILALYWCILEVYSFPVFTVAHR